MRKVGCKLMAKCTREKGGERESVLHLCPCFNDFSKNEQCDAAIIDGILHKESARHHVVCATKLNLSQCRILDLDDCIGNVDGWLEGGLWIPVAGS